MSAPKAAHGRKRLIIAEDHTILREGLKSLLSSNPGLEIVGEAVDGRDAIAAVDRHAPDLLLIDLSMPRMNGMEAIAEVSKRYPQTKILVLTVHKTEEYILAAMQAGANGYVLKDATHGELLTAINTVLSDKVYLSPDISGKIIEGYLLGKKSDNQPSTWDSITQREREILKMVAEGYRNKEIADFLCISIRTVDKHRTNLMRKLDLHTVSAITLFAMEKGLITK
jgi:DNA-binding NarL/FixJ family response regulator